ncbi:hypothetical protein BDZ91DRAFT_682723 [Kalaharituber pfeilii]|nr:hypothetical protein BDZ91DRAFT_682723 [Kalaharituber pfeilii]
MKQTILLEEEEPMPPLDYENRGGQIVAVCVAATVVIGLLVPMRLWVRMRIVRWLGWDDWMIVLATASSITLNAVSIAMVSYGAGRHATTIPPADFIKGLKLNLITQLLNLVSILFVKLSICFFLARLAPAPIYNRLCYGTAIFMTIYTIACEFTIAFQCVPMGKIWNRAIEGTCFSISTLQGLSYTYSAVNILTDFFLVILPVPMIWTLQIPTRQKAVLTMVLALGLFAAVSSLVKLRYTVNYGKAGDLLWDTVDLAIWSVAEINVAIFCACMPALKPLFKRFLEHTGLTASSSNKNCRSGGQSASRSHPLANLSKSAVSAGVRRGNTRQSSKQANDSEESIFAKAGQELGIHVPERQSIRSLEEGGHEPRVQDSELK